MTTPKQPLERITIDTGVKRVAIENQHGEITGEISFNIEDTAFRERFFSMRADIDKKMLEFESTAKEMDARSEQILKEAKEYLLDEENETPPPEISDAEMTHSEKENKLNIEICDFMSGLVDDLFGADTSKNITNGIKNPSIYMQFLEGITPYLNKAREKNIAKYAPPRRSKKRKRGKR